MIKFVITLVGLLAVATATAESDKPLLTRETGAGVGDNQNTASAGINGPLLLQDVHMVEKLAHFDRERIPERVVHARGTGAHGVFESSGDYSDLTMLAPFQEEGKKTDMFVRFSTVINSKGSPEAVRDPRGFALRFYTEDGNWDLVGNNLPIFFIRDGIKFPDFIHANKPSPIYNVQDPNRYFDFFQYTPESTHMLLFLYSDLGTPKSYRFMDGNGVHAFKLVNKDGDVTYAKFNWQTKQGVMNFTAEENTEQQGMDFNHATRDLYDAIDAGDYPQWDLFVQTVTPDELETEFDFNPLDDTKLWSEERFPLKRIGTFTLNRVPDNFFEFSEQVALCPSNMVRGVQPSEDRMLQTRLFSYSDTQDYRVGVNHNQLPVNKPLNVFTYNQEGTMSNTGKKDDINFEPNTQDMPKFDDGSRFAALDIDGPVQQKAPFNEDMKPVNFRQAGETYRSWSESDQMAACYNLGGDLSNVKSDSVRNQITAHMYQADKDLGECIGEIAKADMEEVKKIASELED